MHPELVPEGHDSDDLVVLAELREALEQPLEEALLESILLLLANCAGERLLHVWIEQVRQLPVIADKDDTALRQRHRNKEIEGVRSRRLIHDDVLELEVNVLAALRDDDVVPDRLLAGCSVDGCVVLQQSSDSVRVLPKRCGILLQRVSDPPDALSHAIVQSSDRRVECVENSRIEA